MKVLFNSILSLHRYSKRIIAIITDLGFCILCTWLAYTLRLEELIQFKNFNFFKFSRIFVNRLPLARRTLRAYFESFVPKILQGCKVSSCSQHLGQSPLLTP